MCVGLPYNSQVSTLSDLLARNPTISNQVLASVVKANLLEPFQPIVKYVRCSDDLFQFSDRDAREPAKVVYLSPYGYWTDLFISIKRVFTGVRFPPAENALVDQLNQLRSGRRVTVLWALDGKRLEAYGEGNKLSLWARIRKAFHTSICQPISQKFYVWWYTETT